MTEKTIKRVRKRKIVKPKTMEAAVRSVARKAPKGKRKKAIKAPTGIVIAAASRDRAVAQFEQEYISDQDGRDVPWHYSRVDRNYGDFFELTFIEGVAGRNTWVSKRKAWWVEVNDRVLEHMKDRVLAMRMREMDKIDEAEGYLMEYMLPLKNKNGTVKRNKETKLPEYALPLGNMAQLGRTVLMLNERKAVLRGDVVSRTEHQHTGGIENKTTLTKIEINASDPVAQMAANLTPEAAAELARIWMLSRDERLAADLLPETVESEHKPDEEFIDPNLRAINPGSEAAGDGGE